jgi:hypothetical protein
MRHVGCVVLTDQTGTAHKRSWQRNVKGRGSLRSFNTVSWIKMELWRDGRDWTFSGWCQKVMNVPFQWRMRDFVPKYLWITERTWSLQSRNEHVVIIYLWMNLCYNNVTCCLESRIEIPIARQRIELYIRGYNYPRNRNNGGIVAT